jgi:hypothetical protein
MVQRTARQACRRVARTRQQGHVRRRESSRVTSSCGDYLLGSADERVPLRGGREVALRHRVVIHSSQVSEHAYREALKAIDGSGITW